MRPELPHEGQTPERFHGLEQADSIELLLHLHRYQMAKACAAGKRVLDFGAGDGYGSRVLADVAREVLALDADEREMENASARYEAPGLTFTAGSIDEVERLPAESFDLVTCFEVIEHLLAPEQERLIAGLARVTSRDGMLIMSTPNSAVKGRHYESFPEWRNPYHVRELTLEELRLLLSRRFSAVVLAPQVVEIASLVGLSGTSRDDEVPVTAAWVNVAFAGKTRTQIPERIPRLCLPRKMLLLEGLLVEERRKANELASVHADLDRVLQDRNRLDLELANAQRQISQALLDVETQRREANRLALELDAMSQRLAVRASRALDRWPRAKRAVSALGNLIVRR